MVVLGVRIRDPLKRVVCALIISMNVMCLMPSKTLAPYLSTFHHEAVIKETKWEDSNFRIWYSFRYRVGKKVRLSDHS